MSNFLDHAKVFVKAGKGGDGMVAFRREKYVPDGGPAGGDGGKGGSVIFRVDEGLGTLLDFRYNRHFKAKNGENGMSKSKYGADAEDLYVKVPPGTIVRNAHSGEYLADLTEHGQLLTVARGGRGGRGNIRFATHKNPAPSIAENGEPGEEFELELELKLIADVALVGFPSVGKSTLLSVISNAKPKIAEYEFTTIEPNLGVVSYKNQFEFIVADMPGLIEGASEGIGLGIQFLKHIERTKVLLHVVDMAGVYGRDPFQDFTIIMNELSQYHPKLIERPMLIVANKMDLVEAEELLIEFKDNLTYYCEDKEMVVPKIIEISTWNTNGIEQLIKETADLVMNTKFEPLEEKQEQTHYTLEVSPDFEVEQLDEHHYRISGQKIEKLFAMTNMAHDESIARFTRQMRGMGIDDALRDLGAQSGDIIELSTFQFEFID